MKNDTYLDTLNRIKKANGMMESAAPTPAKDPKQDEGKPAGVEKNENKTTTPPDTNIDTPPATASSTEKLASNVTAALDRINALLGKKEASTEGTPAEEPKPEANKEASTEGTPAEGKPAEEPKPEANKEASTEGAPAEEPKPEANKEASTEGTPAEGGPAEGAGKQAGKDFQLPESFDENAYYKLAHAILSSEEGMAMAEELIVKQAGRERAEQLISDAVAMEAYYKEASAQERAAQEELAAFLEEFSKTASAEDKANMEKMAAVHAAMLETMPHEYAAAAYVKGASDAAMMADQMALGEEGDPMMGADGPMGVEEILEVLAGLVESGQLDEATAQAIAEELLAGEAGAAMPEEAKMAAVLLKECRENPEQE